MGDLVCFADPVGRRDRRAGLSGRPSARKQRSRRARSSGAGLDAGRHPPSIRRPLEAPGRFWERPRCSGQGRRL